MWQRIADHYRISAIEAEHLPMWRVTRAKLYFRAQDELAKDLEEDSNWPPKGPEHPPDK